MNKQPSKSGQPTWRYYWNQGQRLIQLMRSTRTSPSEALDLLIDQLSYYQELDQRYEERRHIDRPALPFQD